MLSATAAAAVVIACVVHATAAVSRERDLLRRLDNICRLRALITQLADKVLILALLRSGEKCACKLLEELQIGQSTLSHHMKILCDAGVVQGRKEGKWVHYSLDPAGAARAKQLLEQQLALSGTGVQDDGPCCGGK